MIMFPFNVKLCSTLLRKNLMLATYLHFPGKLEEAQALSSARKHLRPGSAVKTKFGDGKIRVFRPEVRSVCVRSVFVLFFCTRSAQRITIHIRSWYDILP